MNSVLDLDFETMTGGSLGVKYSGRYVSIRISHVGIESEIFARTARSQEVAARVAEIRKKFAPRRIIIGVDDLDMVKGSALKLQVLSFFPLLPSYCYLMHVIY
jgi:trehalose-6-phosphate synthase